MPATSVLIENLDQPALARLLGGTQSTAPNISDQTRQLMQLADSQNGNDLDLISIGLAVYRFLKTDWGR
jgi:hypothetical protein